MVPIYALSSFLSILWYKYSIYFSVIQQCYEAFAIASFFSLICSYTAPDLHEQKNYFRILKPKSWPWPVSGPASFKKCCGADRKIFATPRNGLTWFNVSITSPGIEMVR
jgi:hypothetical protein